MQHLDQRLKQAIDDAATPVTAEEAVRRARPVSRSASRPVLLTVAIIVLGVAVIMGIASVDRSAQSTLAARDEIQGTSQDSSTSLDGSEAQAEAALIESASSSLNYDFSASEMPTARSAYLVGDDLQRFLDVGRASGVIAPEVATQLADAPDGLYVLILTLDDPLPHPGADDDPRRAGRKLNGDTVLLVDDPVNHAGIIKVLDSESVRDLSEFVK